MKGFGQWCTTGMFGVNYIQKKMSALQRDPGYKNFVHYHRDIMPNCLLKYARGLFPNPENMQYMGHLWEWSIIKLKKLKLNWRIKW